MFGLGLKPKWRSRLRRTCGAGPRTLFLPCVLLPPSAMADDAAAVVAVEKEKLRVWCEEQGIETTGDLAFWFTSFDEALQQAGRAVASAWLDARAVTARGISALVRDL